MHLPMHPQIPCIKCIYKCTQRRLPMAPLWYEGWLGEPLSDSKMLASRGKRSGASGKHLVLGWGWGR